MAGPDHHRDERVAATVEAIHARIRRAGHDAAAWRGALAEAASDSAVLRSLLHRELPPRLLELVGATAPWNEDPLVLGALAMNPRTPRHVALRIVPALYWRDLAHVAASARVTMAVRNRADGQLRDLLPEMRPGDRISLARLATPVVLRELLRDPDVRVLDAALENPRLTADELVAILRSPTAAVELLEHTAASFRWRERYDVRVALVRQPRTPLGVALAQLTSLVPGDLRRARDDDALVPLVRMAAARLLESRRPDSS